MNFNLPIKYLKDKMGAAFAPLGLAKGIFHSNGKHVEEILDETAKKITNHIHINQFPRLAVETTDTGRIQRAIDYIVNQTDSTSGFAIWFDAKEYKINSTAYIRRGNNTIPPILLLGQLFNPRGHGNLPHKNGTCFTCDTVGGTMFRLQLDENRTATTTPDKQVQYLGFGVSNIYFKTDVAGVTAFDMWRVRSTMTNLHFSGFDYAIKQEKFDSTNNADYTNYCDQSKYSGIAITQSRGHGIKLYMADSTKIEDIWFEMPYSDNEYLLEVTGGSNVNINNIHSSFNHQSANYGPGVTKTASNAIIKLDSLVGFEVRGIYVEHTWHKYLMKITNCIGGKVTPVREKFDGNTTFFVGSTCQYIDFFGQFFDSDKLPGEYDFEFESVNGATARHIKIKDNRLANFTGTVTRRTPTFKDNIKPRMLEMGRINLRIYYDGAAWKVVDANGYDVSSYLGGVSWASDGIIFDAGSILEKAQHFVFSPRYITSTSVPLLPVYRNVGAGGAVVHKISFMDMAASTRAGAPSTRMDFDVTVELPI